MRTLADLAEAMRAFERARAPFEYWFFTILGVLFSLLVATTIFVSVTRPVGTGFDWKLAPGVLLAPLSAPQPRSYVTALFASWRLPAVLAPIVLVRFTRLEVLTHDGDSHSKSSFDEMHYRLETKNVIALWWDVNGHVLVIPKRAFSEPSILEAFRTAALRTRSPAAGPC